ncbi:hypothetical protein [Lysobacter enzymogenes]|uniref:hypothetical protein n=1 Tax=Lysobacter enzymogenes TaxID=69 RepID=UPI00111609DF|nr:hypothetical protein [Lysobacter enzymogenes]QQQ00763.1 hypothetical protein JHW41_22265 [Lysobacter enzymogenes]UZW60217.1 hypothetical protein BV903_023560 [Lysobacter enzymogenes]
MRLSLKSFMAVAALAACGCSRAEPPVVAPAPASVASPAASQTTQAKTPMSFEQAVAGFPRCELPGLYIDLETGQPASPYFADQRLAPCETTDKLTTYCLKERFHGLPVAKLAIPNTTFPVFALYFDADLATARKTLSRTLGSQFKASKKSRDGIVPELLADPQDGKKSILVCTKEF